MSVNLSFDLDTLDREQKLKICCLIMAYGQITIDDEIDRAIAFGKPAEEQQPAVDTGGPSLVVGSAPSPPPPVPVTRTTASIPAIAEITAGSAVLPWDGRIHASSKAKNADGSWRIKRGADKALIDSVTTELLRAMAAPGPQLVQALPPPPPQTQTVPAPPVATQASPDARAAYVGLVGRASAAVGAGRVTQDQINKCIQALGVDNMPSLGHRLDLVPAACNLIDGVIAGQSA